MGFIGVNRDRGMLIISFPAFLSHLYFPFRKGAILVWVTNCVAMCTLMSM